MAASPGEAEAWSHRLASANGARFHLVETGRGPLVLFLHGFPEFWWAWRHQLSVVAAAGYRTAALDMRGYGESDKPPRGYDPLTLAADVAGVVRTLGCRDAVLVGQGWGGYVGWAVAAAHPGCVVALCSVGAPHPAEMLRWPVRLLLRTPGAHLAVMQLPWLPERRIRRRTYLNRHLAAWSSDGSDFPTAEAVERYRAALAMWPSPHCALEYHRWLFRSRLRSDGRAFSRTLRRPIDVPVLQINGSDDPAVVVSAVRASARHVRADHQERWLNGAGHFPHEEVPDDFNRALVGWLLHGATAGVDGAV